MPSTTNTAAICEHCGAPLTAMTIPWPDWFEADGDDDEMVIGYEQCTCEAARREADRRMYQERDTERKRAAEKLLSCGIRPRYLGARHPRSKEVEEACASRRNVYIHGASGSYKTTLASAAAIPMILSGRFKSVQFCTSTEIIEEIRKASFRQRSSYDPLERYKAYSVLVIDDLGKESPTDWVIEKLFDIVNERYNSMLPTVVTTQFSPSKLIEQLSKHGGEESAVAIVSRLRAKAEGALLIDLGEEDMRMRLDMDGGGADV